MLAQRNHHDSLSACSVLLHRFHQGTVQLGDQVGALGGRSTRFTFGRGVDSPERVAFEIFVTNKWWVTALVQDRRLVHSACDQCVRENKLTPTSDSATRPTEFIHKHAMSYLQTPIGIVVIISTSEPRTER